MARLHTKREQQWEQQQEKLNQQLIETMSKMSKDIRIQRVHIYGLYVGIITLIIIMIARTL